MELYSARIQIPGLPFTGGTSPGPVPLVTQYLCRTSIPWTGKTDTRGVFHTLESQTQLKLS